MLPFYVHENWKDSTICIISLQYSYKVMDDIPAKHSVCRSISLTMFNLSIAINRAKCV